MRQSVSTLALAGILLVPGIARTQPAPPVEALPPPPIPDELAEGETLEPEVTIRTTPGGTIEEYRVHGRLVRIKVIPRGGYPYYLVDADGDGYLETTGHELAPPFLIPAWVLFRW